MNWRHRREELARGKGEPRSYRRRRNHRDELAFEWYPERGRRPAAEVSVCCDGRPDEPHPKRRLQVWAHFVPVDGHEYWDDEHWISTQASANGGLHAWHEPCRLDVRIREERWVPMLGQMADNGVDEVSLWTLTRLVAYR